MAEQPPSAPRTEAGRGLINDFLNGPGRFGFYAGIDRYNLKAGILAIESEAAATERRATVEKVRDGVMFLPLTVEDEVQLHLVLAILDRSGEER